MAAWVVPVAPLAGGAAPDDDRSVDRRGRVPDVFPMHGSTLDDVIRVADLAMHV